MGCASPKTKDPYVKEMSFKEATSPLTSPDRLILVSPKGHSPNPFNNLKQEGIRVPDRARKGEKLLKETKRLWNWCGRVLEDFSRKPEAGTFLEPVDWEKLGLPQEAYGFGNY